MPVAKPYPPPPPILVLLSIHILGNDLRFEFAHVDICQEVVSIVLATTAMTRVSGTVVVAPVIENDELAVEEMFPEVTSHGFPTAAAPRTATIRPIIWSDEAAVAVGAP